MKFNKILLLGYSKDNFSNDEWQQGVGFDVVYNVGKLPTVELDWKGTTGFLFFIAKKNRR